MKISKIVLPLVLATLSISITGCGRDNSSSVSEAGDTQATAQATTAAQATSTAKPATSSSATKVTSTSAQNNNSTVKTVDEIVSSMISEGTLPVEDKTKDYKIFSKAPVIKFTTTSNTDFATTPTKDSDKPEVAGKYTVENCPEEYQMKDVAGAMKVRGNYTSNYQKKPFRIKFDKKQNLFGLNEGQKYKKWVLLAEVKDTAMLRNSLAFYLSRNMMDPTLFASDFTPAHLYINNQYWGLYLLGEQKEVKEGRVNVAEPESDTYEGADIGYLFELDHYYEGEIPDGDPTFVVDYKPATINTVASGENHSRFEAGYTLGSDITNKETQIPYIKNRVEITYTAIYDAVKSNKCYAIENEKLVATTETDTEKALDKIIDIDSFVSMYLLHEIACDPDVGYSSFYLSFDASAKGNKKLTLNCPWDWDSAFGVRAGTVENGKGMYASVSSNPWLSLLTQTDWFMNRVNAKWNELKEAKLFEKAAAMIDDFSTRYSADYSKNFNKWTHIMGNNPETNFELRTEAKNFKTEKEAATFLKNWFNTRISYLDTALVARKSWTKEFTEFKKTSTPVRLEAENAVTDGTKKTVEGENVSNGGYVGDLDGTAGKKITFTYNSSKATKAMFSVGLSARNNDITFGNTFTLTVNGVEVTEMDDSAIPKGVNGRDYHYWTSKDVCFIDLTAGNNTIELTSKVNCTNFDYIDLYIPN